MPVFREDGDSTALIAQPPKMAVLGGVEGVFTWAVAWAVGSGLVFNSPIQIPLWRGGIGDCGLLGDWGC
jgi:hypothetical protein